MDRDRELVHDFRSAESSTSQVPSTIGRMSLWPKSLRVTRVLVVMFFTTTVLLASALAGGWWWVSQLALKPVAFDGPPPKKQAESASIPVSPLLLRYQLDLPGRGEIFPALMASNAADYWPVAILTITNQADRPVLQEITAEVPGWSRPMEQTIVLGASETRSLRINPELLPAAYANGEIRRSALRVRVKDPAGAVAFSQSRPVLLHSASDLFWGKKFANAQVVARWVTPHDSSVLKLISEAKKHVPNGRMPGYNRSRATTSPKSMAAQVRAQAKAVFEALRNSGVSYVSSIYTFGNFVGEAQRIRFPRETLSINTANCIDMSVAFASAMENLGMNPVIVIVPGHAFTGVRLGPQSQDTLYLDLTVLPRGTFEQAVARAENWIRKTAPNEVLTVDVASARVLGVYPMPMEAPPVNEPGVTEKAQSSSSERQRPALDASPVQN